MSEYDLNLQKNTTMIGLLKKWNWKPKRI
jgi:hypothetical protein